MAIIPADEKVFMVDKRTNTVYGGSAALQAMQQWYTMQDVIDTVGGGASYREYYGIIRVLGATPVVEELQNTIGVPLTFTNPATGQYIISFGSEQFIPNKVFSIANSGVGGAANLRVVGGGPDSGKFLLYTYDTTGALSNIQGNPTCINIRVYN
jgi:hypothetical protein